MPPRKKAGTATGTPTGVSRTAESVAPVKIERVDINYPRLATVTKVIKLHGIDMLDLSFLSMVDPRTLDHESGETAFSHGPVDARWFRRETQLDVVLGLRVVGHLASDPTDGSDRNYRDLFSLTARYLISYSLPEGFTIDGDESEVMADMVLANGQINAFPYFRQLVVEQTARAGWPPLVLDVFRAPQTRVANIVRNAPAYGQS